MARLRGSDANCSRLTEGVENFSGYGLKNNGVLEKFAR